MALNADRWRTATPKWTGTLEDYRRYLVGHEVGHLLGLRHPRVQCPQPGRLAPLLAQQSTELDGCLPNPWPLDAEVQLARRLDTGEHAFHRPLARGVRGAEAAADGIRSIPQAGAAGSPLKQERMPESTRFIDCSPGGFGERRPRRIATRDQRRSLKAWN